LQLYLYDKAVKEKYNDGSKKIAGLYYLPISDKYEKQEEKIECISNGKTLDEENAVELHGKGFLNISKTGKVKNAIEREVLEKYVDYAVAVSEKAVERMDEGVIIPSPYQNTCEYCEYGAFCSFNGEKREVETVTENTVTNALKGGKQNADN
jgi:ATP-dependent helicase/DNAse subunit B